MAIVAAELLARAPLTVRQVGLALCALAAIVGLLLFRNRARERLDQERADHTAAEEARTRLESVLESIGDGFIAVDPDWRFTYLNHAAERLLHRERDRMLGEPAWEALGEAFDSFFQRYNHARAAADPGEAAVQFETSTPNGEGWFEVHAFPTADGVAMYLRDVTARHRSEQHLRSISMVDDLTGLLNRRGFVARAGQLCRVAAREGHGLLLIYCDLDDFKQINDTHGHPVGDQALRDLAEILRQTFRESDVVGRLGGDEFAALALESRAATARVLQQRLQQRLAEYNAREDARYQLSLSVGSAWAESVRDGAVEEL
ncbi:MAG TPA: diguanylate cyclase, partial [Longimicrobiaceae bacterium]|nr:diguanylate cyclase [Longimicrobiaceae bacterium]